MSDSEQTQVELWQVQLPNGEVHPATLDQLDAAFERGMVDATTMVLGPGAKAWARLGDLAGIEEEPPAPAAPPIGMDAVVGPSTLRPLVSELDLPPFQPQSSKKRGMAIAIAALVAVGGAAVFALGHEGPTSAVAAGSGAADAQVATPPKPEPPKPAAEPTPSATAPASTLSDEQRKALADADKARLSKLKARAVPSRGASRPPKSGPDPFHKGGDPHDPLNSAL